MRDAPGAAGDSLQRVLFICTGNYYRSRFAELLFNARAQDRQLPWRADSRGTDVVNAGRWNVGPISAFARVALEQRGIEVGPQPRMPIQLSEPDLYEARLVVAVCEHEHRPQLVEQFPAWAERVEYWAVDDLHATAADVAMHTLHEHVEALIARLEQERQRTLRRAE